MWISFAVSGGPASSRSTFPEGLSLSPLASPHPPPVIRRRRTVGAMPKDRDKRVVLSRIYTRTGDDGTTALGDGSRVGKTDPLLAAYGDVDEANSAIGAALSLGGLPADVGALLSRIQNELFDVGADLCNPLSAGPQPSGLRIDASYIEGLEQACDLFNESLPALRSFVLPGGTAGAALLHIARTTVRRAA